MIEAWELFEIRNNYSTTLPCSQFSTAGTDLTVALTGKDGRDHGKKHQTDPQPHISSVGTRKIRKNNNDNKHITKGKVQIKKQN